MYISICVRIHTWLQVYNRRTGGQSITIITKIWHECIELKISKRITLKTLLAQTTQEASDEPGPSLNIHFIADEMEKLMKINPDPCNPHGIPNMAAGAQNQTCTKVEKKL